MVPEFVKGVVLAIFLSLKIGYINLSNQNLGTSVSVFRSTIWFSTYLDNKFTVFKKPWFSIFLIKVILMLGFSVMKFSINGTTLSSGLLSSEISSLYGKDVFSLMLKNSLSRNSNPL